MPPNPATTCRAPNGPTGALDRLTRVSIRIYDTATRQVRDFVPLEAGKAGIYLCGLLSLIHI